MNRVGGKVAIVTGAARGIGAAIARGLINEGASVLLTDVLEKEGAELVSQLGGNAHFLQQDVTSAADWSRAVATAEAVFGPINVLVNNAGILAAQGPIEATEERDFRQVMDINVVSVFLGIRAVMPSMRRAGNGSIVNISSVAGIIGSPQTAAYTASKFAVRGITKAVAMEVADSGIRVNSVHPGYIDTKMIAGMIPAERADEFRQRSSPLGRLGKPEEIANMVLFLASDESSYATGAEFIVDGGFTSR